MTQSEEQQSHSTPESSAGARERRMPRTPPLDPQPMATHQPVEDLQGDRRRERWNDRYSSAKQRRHSVNVATVMDDAQLPVDSTYLSVQRIHRDLRMLRGEDEKRRSGIADGRAGASRREHSVNVASVLRGDTWYEDRSCPRRPRQLTDESTTESIQSTAQLRQRSATKTVPSVRSWFGKEEDLQGSVRRERWDDRWGPAANRRHSVNIATVMSGAHLPVDSTYLSVKKMHDDLRQPWGDDADSKQGSRQRGNSVNVATVTRGDPWAEEKPKPSTPDRPSAVPNVATPSTRATSDADRPEGKPRGFQREADSRAGEDDYQVYDDGKRKGKGGKGKGKGKGKGDRSDGKRGGKRGGGTDPFDPEAFLRLPSWRGMERECAQAIRAFAQQRRVPDAIDVLETMGARGAVPNVFHFTAAVNACSRASQWALALELVESMEQLGVTANIVTYNTAISACARASQTGQALRVLQRMQQVGIEPDVISYSSVISSCTNEGEWSLALQLLQGMEQRGVWPDVVTYGAAIAACEKAAQWRTALGLLYSMGNRQLAPNAVVINSAISACQKAGQWAKAIELLMSMEQYGIQPDVISYTSAISACGCGGQWERALGLLSMMEGCGVAADNALYCAAISACARGAQWPRALELLASMGYRGVTPTVATLNAALDACYRHWPAALHLLQEMELKGPAPNAVSYKVVGMSCGTGGRWDLALRLLAEMRSRAAVEGSPVDNVTAEAPVQPQFWENAATPMVPWMWAARSMGGHGAALPMGSFPMQQAIPMQHAVPVHLPMHPQMVAWPVNGR